MFFFLLLLFFDNDGLEKLIIVNNSSAEDSVIEVTNKINLEDEEETVNPVNELLSM